MWKVKSDAEVVFRLTIDVGDYQAIEFVTSATVSGMQTNDESRLSVDSSTASVPGLRVLVVDDGATNRKLVSLVFASRWSHRVVGGKRQGGLRYGLQGGNFDVILMDMQMPVLDGYADAHAARSWNNSADFRTNSACHDGG